MRNYLKKIRIPVGWRTLKTSIAVAAAILMVEHYGTSADELLFGVMGAFSAMEPTFKSSVRGCVAQISGVVVGVVLSLLMRFWELPGIAAASAGIILIMAAVRTTKEDIHISPLTRLGIFGIVLIEVIGMHAIFLVDTSIYSDTIIGVQGRYFVLFIPLILLLFRNNGLVFQEKKEYLYPCYSMAQLVYLYFFLEMFMCA